MSNYAIIADNGGSDLEYRDIVGEVYTFPKSYVNILLPGTKFVYQRCGLSSMKVQEPDKERLLDEPHYFGIAEIGKVTPIGNNLYEAEIINYKHFVKGVPFRLADGSHLEVARGQFWRNGVRQTIKEVYDEIVAASSGVIPSTSPLAHLIPPETTRTPVVTKTDNIRKTAKNRSSVQIKEKLQIGINSLSFANDCLEVVTDRSGYWLHSLVNDNKYYLIAHMGTLPYNNGAIKIRPQLIQKEPIQIKSDKKFGVFHTFGSDAQEIGRIEIKDNEIEFRGAGNSAKTIDVVKIPLTAVV